MKTKPTNLWITKALLLGLLLGGREPGYGDANNDCIQVWTNTCHWSASAVPSGPFWTPADPPLLPTGYLVCQGSSLGAYAMTITNLGEAFHWDVNGCEDGAGDYTYSITPIILRRWWTLSTSNGVTSGDALSGVTAPAAAGPATLTFHVSYTNVPPCTDSGTNSVSAALDVMDGPRTNDFSCSGPVITNSFSEYAPPNPSNTVVCVGDPLVAPTVFTNKIQFEIGKSLRIVYECPGPTNWFITNDVFYTAVSTYWDPEIPTNGFAYATTFDSTLMVVCTTTNTNSLCLSPVTLPAGTIEYNVLDGSGSRTSCDSGPKLVNKGTLSYTWTNVCVGQSIRLPTADGYVVGPGHEVTVSRDCTDPTAPPQVIPREVPYSPGVPFTVPDFPGSFGSVGTYTYSVEVLASPSPGESMLCGGVVGFSLGTVTIVVTDDRTTNSTCFVSGTLTNQGTLTSSSVTTCVGSPPVSFPGYATAPAFSDGTSQAIIVSCGNTNAPQTNYPAFHYAVSTFWVNSLPSPLTNGTYTVTNYIVGTPPPSSGCLPQTNLGPTFTVVLNPAPATNHYCYPGAQIGSVSLATNQSTICISNVPTLPSVASPQWPAGTNLTAYSTCDASWHSNSATFAYSVVTRWGPQPTQLNAVGSYSFTCYAEATPQGANACGGPITNQIATFTVNVVETFTTNYSCVQAGGLASNVAPSTTNVVACAGSSPPQPTVGNLAYTNGTVKMQVLDCNAALRIDTNLPVAYSASGPYFNPPWPTTIGPGTTNITMYVVGTPDNTTCAKLTNSWSVAVSAFLAPVSMAVQGYNATNKYDPGVILFVNNDDDDTNCVPDHAQGYGIVTNEDDLVEITFKNAGLAPTNLITLSVSASSSTGQLKLWLSPQRGPLPPVIDTTNGMYSYSFVASNMPSLYMEGVSASPIKNDVTLSVSAQGCEGCPDQAQITVEAPVIQYLTESGEADEIQDEADPRPLVELHFAEAPYVDDDGNLVVNVSGQVTDPLSDLAFDPANRVQALNFRVNGSPAGTIANLPSLSSGGSSWPWHPNYFSVNFERTFVFQNPGGSEFQVYAETSTNAAGKTGSASVHVTVGWTQVDAYYPGFVLPTRANELASVMNIVFSSVPTNTVVDTARVYFGDRPPTNWDATFTETGTNTLIFTGSLTNLGASQTPVELVMTNFNYCPGVSNDLQVDISYLLSGTNRVEATCLFTQTDTNCLRFKHVSFVKFGSGGGQLSGNWKKFNVAQIDTYEELGGNPEGSLEPMIVKVTGISPATASKTWLSINGVDHALVSFPSAPGEYYIANSANPSWPRIFVNKLNAIPGGMVPNLQVLSDPPDGVPSLNMTLKCSDGRTPAQWRGDVRQSLRLLARPPAPCAAFTVQDLLAHFYWYNEMTFAGKAGPIPDHPEISWSVVYSNMLAYFVAGGNSVDVGNLWFKDMTYGAHAKIKGWLASPRTIVVDNTHQTVWCGVFGLEDMLCDSEASAWSSVPPYDPWEEPPQSYINDFLRDKQKWAAIKQAAHCAGQLANMEMIVYTTILPGGNIAATVPAVAEGDPIAIAQTLLHVRGMTSSSISGAKFCQIGKFKHILVEEAQLARGPVRAATDRRVFAIDLGLRANASFEEVRAALFKAIKEKKGLFATGADEAVFYSGQWTKGGAAYNGEYAVGYVATSPGKKVIEDTDGGKWLMDQVADIRDRYTGTFSEEQLRKLENQSWGAGSHWFATQASGEVVSFTAGADLTKTYIKIEMPRIRENGAITSVRTVFPTP